MKYQSSSTHCSKVLSQVKVKKKWVKLQGQGHSVKWKGLITRKTHVKYIKDLALTVQVINKVKNFSKIGQTPRSRSQGKK